MSIFRQLVSMVAVGACLLLHGTPGHAHSTFPQATADELGMPCTPACTICHRDNLGGFGTVTTPFGKVMQANGLIFLERSLSPALTKLDEAGTDSDGDGVGDVMELRAGQDPNGSIDLCSQAALAARYGCGAHIASPPERDFTAPIAALLTALVLGATAHRAARRRRSRSSGG